MSNSPFEPPPGQQPNPYGYPLLGPGMAPPVPGVGMAPGMPQRGGRTGLFISLSVVGAFVFVALCVFMLFFFNGTSGGGGYASEPTDPPSVYEVTGTLPQAVAGQDYTAEQIKDAVERTLYEDASYYYGITCLPLPDLSVNAATTCDGDVDGDRTHMTITMDDEAGHFTMVQKW